MSLVPTQNVPKGDTNTPNCSYSAAFAPQYRTLGALVVTYATFNPALDVRSVLARPVFAFALTGSTVTPAYDGLATAPLWLRVTERIDP